MRQYFFLIMSIIILENKLVSAFEYLTEDQIDFTKSIKTLTRIAEVWDKQTNQVIAKNAVIDLTYFPRSIPLDNLTLKMDITAQIETSTHLFKIVRAEQYEEKRGIGTHFPISQLLKKPSPQLPSSITPQQTDKKVSIEADISQISPSNQSVITAISQPQFSVEEDLNT